MAAGLKINPQKIEKKLINFIKSEVNKAGSKNAVIGLSGGIDSTVIAYLSVKALGKEHVTGLLMPYETSNSESVEDARLVVNALGINSEYVDITPMINAYFEKFPQADRIRRGNKMARERMSVLYDLSKISSAIVIGTGNKTEVLLGYGTIHGDMACGIAPLGNLYKTQVRELARYLNIPEKILSKVPSADLWEGQTDEGELGVDYDTADKVLNMIYDRKMPVKMVIKKGFNPEIVINIIKRVKANTFKRQLPAVPR